MLRFLSFACELLSGLCALLSPVAVIHWLLRILGVPALTQALGVLDPLFRPMNAMVELVIKVPPLNYGDQEFSMTQGVLACLLTASFFVLSTCAEALKGSDQQMKVRWHSRRQEQNIRKRLLSEQKSRQQVMARQLIVWTDYEFAACLPGAALIRTRASESGGTLLESHENGIVLKFDTLEPALWYCSEVFRGLESHYATLRPMDPQPPFRIAIHATAEEPSPANIRETWKLTRYVGKNQVVFSQDVKIMMESVKQEVTRSYRSIGLYEIAGRQQELFVPAF